MIKIISIIGFLLCSFGAHANEKIDAVSVYIGEGSPEIGIYRVGVQRSFDQWLSRKNIPLTGFFESSVNIWDGSNTIFGLAISPVFSYAIYRFGKYELNLHAGIGVALISETTISGRDMSSAFQFEDRAGFELKGDRVDFYALYLHYSNASLVQPNDGIDIFSFGINIKF